MGKVYFVSDLHLGVPGRLSSREREALFVKWLDDISVDAEELYLIGDLFDFFFEYNTVVPKGYVRLFGKLAELSDGGLPIYFFTGNHDMWIFDYFEKELGIETYRSPITRTIQGKKLYIGHGDGLGPGDRGYKFIKKVFANKVCQWLFERLHPNFGISLANFWSKQSRYANPSFDRFHKDTEWLVDYANDYLKHTAIDFFIFGHRHIPIDHKLDNGISRYINTGEWLHSQSYAIMEDGQIKVVFYKREDGEVFG